MTAAPSSPLPLAGIGVAVTRAEPPQGPLARRFSRLGANVLSWQSIEIAPPRDAAPLRRAVEDFESYDWIVFTSVHAVSALKKALTMKKQSWKASPRIAAVGRSTALTLESAGLAADLVPERFSAAALLELFRALERLRGARVLIPASSISRPELADGLAALGAHVDRVTAYETRPSPLDVDRCRRELAAGHVDVVTFTSPSAVAGLSGAFGSSQLARTFQDQLVISIGATTSCALRDHGLEPNGEGQPSSLDGLVTASIAALAARLSAALAAKVAQRASD